ncbi:folate transporter 1, chloroplastic-like [Raphanus sativus]|uniref:Folate transporter 1, chloroplastic-like n=1 Tax=Raphanus sativus TaxID=3726 RepID=A0A9W3CE45_RAPSA|nr:folate transporter 1, chloroplastic-like [Raphanus sativus]
MKEEGPWAFYKGIVPALLLVSLLSSFVFFRTRETMLHLGAPPKSLQFFLHIHFRLFEQDYRPSPNGMPRYIDSLHVIRETARFEGLRGFYKGLTANLLKTVPASSITFIVYENVLKRLKQPPTK